MILLNAFIAGSFVFGDAGVGDAGVGVAGVAGFSGEVTGFTGFIRDSSNSCSVSFLGHCSLSRILIPKALFQALGVSGCCEAVHPLL